jgi:hypothetical protein
MVKKECMMERIKDKVRKRMGKEERQRRKGGARENSRAENKKENQ